MGIKLQESGAAIICAKVDPALPFTMRWICRRTKDWAIANVKISDTGDYHDGVKSGRITITFDVSILEQLGHT